MTKVVILVGETNIYGIQHLLVSHFMPCFVMLGMLFLRAILLARLGLDFFSIAQIGEGASLQTYLEDARNAHNWALSETTN